MARLSDQSSHLSDEVRDNCRENVDETQTGKREHRVRSYSLITCMINSLDIRRHVEDERGDRDETNPNRSAVSLAARRVLFHLRASSRH